MKDTDFYNKESECYSQKRYAAVPVSYTQFFFNRRLAITKKYISRIIAKTGGKLSLLELGCADGIVVRELARAFPDAFSGLIGIDISPGMIGEAQKQNTTPYARFMLRDAYMGMPPVDVITETGVINYAGFDNDIKFVLSNLKEHGWYVLSVAGTGSLRNILKPEKDFKDFRTYREYERLLKETFEIREVTGCGMFIPLIWRFPALARTTTAVLETMCGNMFPGLCHEKVYLLQKR